ncbi:50S ribosomal protein L3 N(5)-glutamine methyltransferase [Azoarcus olearius]|uniref:Ribosomal protein uL3 glutamine methyltransferase n=1 Tax=Azoarcus sp. (strain BH72) TaxID=418699 RepID=A1K720_AZOSB|nr:50S ribosomal protein L3 N(5)-glutamine methyltransferase [Azoarcus olearius]ANQ85200.1 N5-glutamine S-adenosyl-L-methionine-dependent methyltransferase [Azoarcus olearius]CAL94625.1 site-specific DNA-methyltransferase (adenine-specific) [Azoarcus olearius]
MSHHENPACDDPDCNDADHDHEHEHGPLAELVTVRDWLRYALTRFNRERIFCGHGVLDTYDEAVWLILSTLALPLDRLEPFLDACIPSDERVQIFEAIERRVVDRVPTAYITQEAWLGEFRFHVDERVIVPRSFFAELLEEGMAPWVEDPEQVSSALDLCTGSGCLAILMAHAFPNAQIVGVDLSDDALDVAAENVADYGLEDRVELVKSDVFDALDGRRFDFILSNPPYVTADAMASLPPEYLHEPRMALAAGDDGLDVVRRLLAQARDHLTPKGFLAVEVGHNRDIVEAAFPELSFTWLSCRGGDDMIFLLHRDELPG